MKRATFRTINEVAMNPLLSSFGSLDNVSTTQIGKKSALNLHELQATKKQLWGTVKSQIEELALKIGFSSASEERSPAFMLD